MIKNYNNHAKLARRIVLNSLKHRGYDRNFIKIWYTVSKFGDIKIFCRQTKAETWHKSEDG